MKKVVICIVMMLCAMSSVAQRVVDARRVENANGKYFVMLDTFRVEVSPLIYKIVEADPTQYCLLEAGDTKSFFLRSSLEEPAMKYVFEVAKVELENDLPKVVMTNGYSFTDKDLAWLAVLQGQKVQISRYIGLTRELIIFETVARSTPVTEGVTAEQASAPAKSRLQEMIKEVQAKAKAKANNDVAQAAAPAASSQPMTITFGGHK
jgi:hypothetical protein